jgi:predicted XRE-type DNA-binding protein
MRADLMAALREHINERGWTQSKAAAEIGITQHCRFAWNLGAL